MSQGQTNASFEQSSDRDTQNSNICYNEPPPSYDDVTKSGSTRQDTLTSSAYHHGQSFRMVPIVPPTRAGVTSCGRRLDGERIPKSEVRKRTVISRASAPGALSWHVCKSGRGCEDLAIPRSPNEYVRR